MLLAMLPFSRCHHRSLFPRQQHAGPASTASWRGIQSRCSCSWTAVTWQHVPRVLHAMPAKRSLCLLKLFHLQRLLRGGAAGPGKAAALPSLQAQSIQTPCLGARGTSGQHCEPDGGGSLRAPRASRDRWVGVSQTNPRGRAASGHRLSISRARCKGIATRPHHVGASPDEPGLGLAGITLLWRGRE